MLDGLFSPFRLGSLNLNQLQSAFTSPLALGEVSVPGVSASPLDMLGGWGGMTQFATASAPCGCGTIPAPSPQFSGAPAGQGLQKSPAGWPDGSVRTAGGYTVVPEGKDQAWNVFGPDQKSGDKPMQHVDGDPHVTGSSGDKFDFSQSSNFVLPDGTKITANTTQQDGHSYTSSLDITNGADHASITGIDKDKPVTSDVDHTGLEFRANQAAQKPGMDTYYLGGSQDDTHFFKGNNGLIAGQVTGSNYTNGSYTQTVDTSKGYVVDPNLKPPIGSDAWGNQLRGEMADAAGLTGNRSYANLVGTALHADDLNSRYLENFGFSPMGGGSALFGGLGSCFSGLGSALGAVGFLGDAVLSRSIAQAGVTARMGSMLLV